jgi:Got1/Sft2-like family protein
MINTNESTKFSNVKKFFSPGLTESPSLPFSYSDATHTHPAPPPKHGWLTSWGTSFGDDSWFETLGLSKIQRYSAFGLFLLAAAFLFLLAFIQLPLVIIRPRKFVVPYCLASLLVALAFGFIHGFVSYAKHLFSPERRLLSLSFYGLTLVTLYVAISLHSYIFTGVFSILQFVSMIAYIVSYVPGGSSGLSMLTTMATGSLFSRF